VIQNFEDILQKCLKPGDEYKKSPPQGPPEEYGVVSDETLKSLDLTEHGEIPQANRGSAYQRPLTLAPHEKPQPSFVELPDIEDLSDIHICGIDGSNQRVQRSPFQLILARAVAIAFRYSKAGETPYFKRKSIDSSAIVWIDGNIFDFDSINLRTRKLPADCKNILDIVGETQEPLLARYDRGEMKKSPASYSLGLAVQIQQTLELLLIKSVPTNTAKMVCIKDGPLFSTSTFIGDTINGLQPVYSWSEQQVLVACSKRVGGSTLLIESLLDENIGAVLKECWFPNQTLLDSTIQGLSSDAILIPRFLNPGHRTPLIQATPIARTEITKNNAWLKPLSCYYMSRNRPYTYVRMEVPMLMWERNSDAVKKAISIVAWQHDLGHSAPLVQLEADRQCDLSAERGLLEVQTESNFAKNDLKFLENYDG